MPELDERLEQAINQGYAVIHGKNDALLPAYQWYCNTHDLATITVYEPVSGRARVRCLLASGMEVTPFARPLIAHVGLSLGLADGTDTHNFNQIKSLYHADGVNIHTCTTIPTSRAIAFASGLVILIKQFTEAFGLVESAV